MSAPLADDPVSLLYTTRQYPCGCASEGTGDIPAYCSSHGSPPTNPPLPMLLWCPGCGQRHIDVDEFATKVHHTHACQSCGMVWRPAVEPTVGVQWLPGFKNRGSL